MSGLGSNGLKGFTITELKVLQKLGFTKEDLSGGRIAIANVQLKIIDRIEAIEKALAIALKT